MGIDGTLEPRAQADQQASTCENGRSFSQETFNAFSEAERVHSVGTHIEGNSAQHNVAKKRHNTNLASDDITKATTGA